MNDLLKQRIGRLLDALSDERGYQILDYIEFLDSKYAERGRPERHPGQDHRDGRGHDARRQAADPGDQRHHGHHGQRGEGHEGTRRGGPGGGGRGGEGGGDGDGARAPRRRRAELPKPESNTGS